MGGLGLGVIFIKLDDDDELVAAVTATTPLELEKATGGTQKVVGKAYKPVARGGKGVELWKRGAVKRVGFPEVTVPNLELAPEDDKKKPAAGKK